MKIEKILIVLKIKYICISITIFFLTILQLSPVQAQTIRLLGGNTLNGAVNGAMLGGATMALRNSNDFAPLRVGLGAGTLFGVGVSVYDIAQISPGQQFYVSATFNDGDNSTIIVLLDTFYGAAGGAIVASSFNLISNKPIVEALQYGSGIGAWVGFGFGLIDAFLLAQRPGDFSPSSGSAPAETKGLLTFSDQDKGYHVGFISPIIYSQAELASSSMKIRSTPAIDMINLHVNL